MIASNKRINASLEKHLTAEYRLILDEFLAQKVAYHRSEILQYKVISQSSRPHEIKKSVEKFRVLSERLEKLKPLINKVKLSDETIDYHAHWITISDSDKIETNSDRYLLLLCFLIRQVRLRQDFFLDLVLQSVNTAWAAPPITKQNACRRKIIAAANRFQDKKQRETGTQLLIDTRLTYKQQINRIKEILRSSLNSDDKVSRIEEVFEIDPDLTEDQLALVATVEDEVSRDSKVEFYKYWQQRSIWLSNRIGQVVNHLIINEEDSEKMLCAAIKHYTEKKGKVKSPAKNLKWLDDKQQDLLWETNEKGEEIFQRRLYKMFLFQAINDGIKSGTLNFNHSYRY